MIVFGLSQAEREATLLPRLAGLTAHHRANSVADLPWLPVRKVKTHDLTSVPDEAVSKTLTSSGTTGARRVPHLTVIGNERLPMLMVDTIGVINNRRSFLRARRRRAGDGQLRPRARVPARRE